MTIRNALASILVAVALATSVTASPQETATETAIRKALVELEGKRAEVAALKETIGAKDAQIAALNNLLDNSAQIIEEWKVAARERAVASSIDAKIEALYQKSIEKYDKELAEVRRDRDRQAAQKKWWFAAGVILGIVTGVVAAKD